MKSKVLKFGGSSLGSPERIRTVADIVIARAKRGPVVVVASAFSGVTNHLLECARLAAKGTAHTASSEQAFARLAKRHREACDELLGRRTGAEVRARVDALLAELHDVLRGIRLLGHCPDRALDLVASFGERLSTEVVAAFLNRTHPAVAVDARPLVITNGDFTQAAVNFEKTNPALRRHLARVQTGSTRRRVIPVVTGFIGSTVDGQTTTIGRNGSDYSAAIVGAAIDASAIEIWTDVDGVLSADPRVVPAAFVQPEVSYEEAMELSYFGAKVLHSATIAPAVAKSIPILIKNTLNPEAPGTIIAEGPSSGSHLAKGITAIDGLTLLTLRGLSMVGVPGIAERLFRALAAGRVNVILISQASSEHTICFAVSKADADRAAAAVHDEFRFEFISGLTSLDVKPDQAILAVVGDGMKGRPGVSGHLFAALGRQQINISAIAQGASERNISCVIDAASQTRALNAIHEAFFEVRRKLALVVVGVGTIGSALLQQLHQQRAYLRDQGFDLTVVAVANSTRFAINRRGINLGKWRDELSTSPHSMSPQALATEIAALNLTDVALVDCTASASVVEHYPLFVEAGLHIITPNKRANVLPWDQYEALMELMRERQRHFLYEANVGAGLPIMSTLADLIASGDRVAKIEGVFSGTLSYLFNHFDGSRPFSAIVEEARTLGLTEPDPREDLSGADVARKLLILARQSGAQMEIADVKVESLADVSDEAMARRLKKASDRGCVLRYVGTLEGTKARAGVKEFPREHPIANTRGSDNIIAFTTTRYSKTPLVVQGPGAGADVTAMGVFSDILKLLHYQG